MLFISPLPPSEVGAAEEEEAVVCSEGPDLCAVLLTFCSLLLILITLPLSLIWSIKVVQEYERAVIFRLGRLLTGGARGPGNLALHCTLRGPEWSH